MYAWCHYWGEDAVGNVTLLLKSTDYGATWSNIYENFTQIFSWQWTSLVVGQHDADKIYIGLLSGGGTTYVRNAAGFWAEADSAGYVRLVIPYASNPSDDVAFAFPTHGAAHLSHKTINGGTTDWTALASISPGQLATGRR